MRASDFLRLLRDAFKGWREDNASRLAASLAYYTLFSLAPLLILAVAFAGLFFGEEAARAEVLAQMEELIGRTGREVAETALRSARQPGGTGLAATAVSLLVLLFGASNTFVQLQDSLNAVWRVRPRPGAGVKEFIRKRLLTFSMVLGIGFLLLVSLLLSAALAAAGKYLQGFVPLPALWQILNLLVSFLVVTLLFAMIFKLLPDAQITWGDVWTGALLTSVLFSAGKFALGLYLGRGSFGSAYGAAGSLVVLLAWVYWSAQILFFGAEFTRIYAHRHGTRPAPEEHAEVSV